MRKNNELELLPIENGNLPFRKTNQNDDQENRPLVDIINENGKSTYNYIKTQTLYFVKYKERVSN